MRFVFWGYYNSWKPKFNYTESSYGFEQSAHFNPQVEEKKVDSKQK